MAQGPDWPADDDDRGRDLPPAPAADATDAHRQAQRALAWATFCLEQVPSAALSPDEYGRLMGSYKNLNDVQGDVENRKTDL